MLERGLLIAVGAAAVIAAVVWVHSVRLQDDAQSLATRPPRTLSPAQVTRALSLFERARAHNPDTRPVVLEAGLLARLGRDRAAIRLLEPVVRSEPANNDAWVLLAIAAANSRDTRLAAAAASRARKLNPLAAQGR